MDVSRTMMRQIVEYMQRGESMIARSDNKSYNTKRMMRNIVQKIGRMYGIETKKK